MIDWIEDWMHWKEVLGVSNKVLASATGWKEDDIQWDREP